MPQLGRVACNLAGVKKDHLVLDPFCGTCGLLLEAFFLNAKTIGIDANYNIIKGAKTNMMYYSIKYKFVNNYDLLVGDASKIPFPADFFDSIITDLPYGHSTLIKGDSLESLYSFSFSEFYRVLKKNSFSVIISSISIKSKLSQLNFKIIKSYQKRVHKSLIRFITVIKKL